MLTPLLLASDPSQRSACCAWSARRSGILGLLEWNTSHLADTLFAFGISEHPRNHRIQPRFFYRCDGWVENAMNGISPDWRIGLSSEKGLSSL